MSGTAERRSARLLWKVLLGLVVVVAFVAVAGYWYLRPAVIDALNDR